jgi:hypothetical protein
MGREFKIIHLILSARSFRISLERSAIILIIT